MSTRTVDDDSWKQKLCNHPNHEPPAHIVIPQGKKLIHTCPGCHSKFIIFPSQ